MRYLLVTMVSICLTMPALAQENDDGTKKDHVNYMVGFGYRSGSIVPALALNESDRHVRAETTIVFAEIRSQRGYAYGETTHPGGRERLATHAFGGHGALASAFGFRMDAGLDYRYLSEPAPVFSLNRTRIESVRRQHSVLFSLGGRWGSYEGFYVRHAGFIGLVHLENSLELFVDGSFQRRNTSDVDSGVIRLHGYRGEAGWTREGFSVRGGGMAFFHKDAPVGYFQDDLMFFGQASYTTPWRIGIYIRGVTTPGFNGQHLAFLDDTVTFGITAGFRQ